MGNLAGRHPQAWKTRREIPNPQIRDAADQYEQARRLLENQPQGMGFLLPLMNSAAMAIELYLKCLAGKVIHVPERYGLGGYVVHAQANTGGHKFTTLMCAIEEDVRNLMESSYTKATGKELKHDLGTIEETLVVSRYPYEPDKDPSRVSLQTLMSISEFLQSFVAHLEPRETIQWKDGSISPIENC